MFIYDIIQWTQPDVFKLLKQLYHIRKPQLRKISYVNMPRLWCDDDEFDFYEAVLREIPKPGTGGLLKGEKAVSL